MSGLNNHEKTQGKRAKGVMGFLRRGALTAAFLIAAVSGAPPASADTASPAPAIVETVKAGQMQSPINLSPTQEAGLSPFEVQYNAAPLSITNDGHGIRVNYPEGSKVTINGKTFGLVQFHFHAPSEYSIGGKHFDMELHLVHKDAEGKLGVIGILIEQGPENAAAAKIIPHLPAASGPARAYPDVAINASDFFPKSLQHYEFQGSLTTPPYSEGVSWFVLSTPIQFSAEQIGAFKSLFPDNARETQPSNNRPVVFRR